MARSTLTWSAAVSQSKLKPSVKLVLLAIGLRMNSYGDGAFPSVKTIAQDCGMCQRTVERSIPQAVEGGFLTVEVRYRKNGGRTSNLYRPVWPAEEGQNVPSLGDESVATPPPSDNVVATPPPATTLSPPGDKSVAPISLNVPIKKNPPIVPPRGGREESFEDPWKDSLDAVATDLSERFHVKCTVDWWQKLAYECMGESRAFESLLKFKANMLAWSDVYREREPGMLPSRSALRYDIKNGMWLAPPPKAQAALAEVDEFNAFVKQSLATNQRHAGELAGVPR